MVMATCMNTSATPGRWQTLMANIRALQALPNVHVMATTTVSMLNVLSSAGYSTSLIRSKSGLRRIRCTGRVTLLSVHHHHQSARSRRQSIHQAEPELVELLGQMGFLWTAETLLSSAC